MKPVGNKEIFILHKSVLNGEDERVLKLDRENSELLVYKKADTETLWEHYSIRKDFDASDYVVYLKEKVLPCIYGGENSPTPEGIFTITAKSEDAYESTYYSKRDKVKFFGYLVIFEDYFIHSDLYESDVTKEDVENGKAVLISKDDTCTAGCIRVRIDDLKWLIREIDEGIKVIL